MTSCLHDQLEHIFMLVQCFGLVASIQRCLVPLRLRISLLCQVMLYAVNPPPLRLSFPSLPLHIHLHHHSLSTLSFCTSQYMSLPLQPMFLCFLAYVSHVHCPSHHFALHPTPCLHTYISTVTISATSNFLFCASFVCPIPALYIIVDLSTVV